MKNKILSLNRYLKIGLVVVIVAAGIGCYILLKPTSNATTYQTSTLEKSTLVVSVSGSGQVANTGTYQITTSAAGVVDEVYVKNNQQVRTGQKILKLTLDTASRNAYTQALSSYQSAKNSLASAQSKQLTVQASMLSSWDSYKELAESDTYKDTGSDNRNLPEFMIPQRQWLAAEMDYKNQTDVIAQSKLALQVAAQNLAAVSPTITAPIAGIISNLSWQTGDVIGSSSTSTTTSTKTTVALVSSITKPSVSVNISEIDAPQIAVGNPATVTFTAYPEKTFTGSVLAIDILGTTSSGVTVYPVTIALDGELPNLLPNMSTEASIITLTKNNVLSIPSSAISTQNGESVVKVMKNGQSSTVTVTTGVTSDSGIEIVAGLNEGDQVITSTTNTGTNAGTNRGTQSVFSSFGGGGVRIPR